MMKKVVRTNRNMVFVFDENGEEMPQYQGTYQDVRDRVMGDARVDTIFTHWYGTSAEPKDIAMESW
jgi:sRNA-binding protein